MSSCKMPYPKISCPENVLPDAPLLSAPPNALPEDFPPLISRFRNMPSFRPDAKQPFRAPAAFPGPPAPLSSRKTLRVYPGSSLSSSIVPKARSRLASSPNSPPARDAASFLYRAARRGLSPSVAQPLLAVCPFLPTRISLPLSFCLRCNSFPSRKTPRVHPEPSLSSAILPKARLRFASSPNSPPTRDAAPFLYRAARRGPLAFRPSRNICTPDWLPPHGCCGQVCPMTTKFGTESGAGRADSSTK